MRKACQSFSGYETVPVQSHCRPSKIRGILHFIFSAISCIIHSFFISYIRLISKAKVFLTSIFLTIFTLLSVNEVWASNQSQLEQWLRYKHWHKIMYSYNDRKPYTLNAFETYALVKARINSLDKKTNRNQFYTDQLRLLLGKIYYACRTSDATEVKFLACLQSIKTESIRNSQKKLILRQAAKFTQKLKFPKLELKIYEIISLKKDVFHSDQILAERIRLMNSIKIPVTKIQQLTKRTKPIIQLSPYALYQAGYLLLRTGSKEQALLYWSKAFLHPDSKKWLQKDIIRDLQKFLSSTLSGNDHRRHIRLLTAFSPMLRNNHIQKLKHKISPNLLLADNYTHNAYPYYINGDGLFLIQTRQIKALLKLAKRYSITIANNINIINDWSELLMKTRQYTTILKLNKLFPESKYESVFYYRNILAAHKKISKKLGLVYFEELLRFIANNPYSIPEHDELIGFLVHQKSGKNHSFANKIYWQKAYQELPRHHSSGRFHYWRKRYYLEKKFPKEDLNKIYEEIYQLAPGSYYIRAFALPAKNNQELATLKTQAARDWRKKVRNRDSYLRWLSHYNALPAKELVKYRTSRYFSPQAKKLSKEITQAKAPLDNKIINELLKVGEWEEALQLYKKTHYYSKKRKDYYISLIKLGKKNKVLNIQVYYTIALLNEYKISIDPFSLPNDLLGLLYPRPFLSLVTKYTQKYKLERAVSYAIMRQESLFRSSAVSSSNARGLMQIIPSTGTWLRKLLKIKPDNLFEPRYNIQLGSYYFSRLLKSYDNDFNWAAIAYNGGPGNLRKWKKRYYRNDDFYLFLETLPVSETRNYCRIVYKNYSDYQIVDLIL